MALILVIFSKLDRYHLVCIFLSLDWPPWRIIQSRYHNLRMRRSILVLNGNDKASHSSRRLIQYTKCHEMSAYVTATDAEKNLQVRLRLKSKSALITQVVKVIGREDESERMEAQG